MLNVNEEILDIVGATYCSYDTDDCKLTMYVLSFYLLKPRRSLFRTGVLNAHTFFTICI